MIYILGTGFLAKNVYTTLSRFFDCEFIGRHRIDLPDARCRILQPYTDDFFITGGVVLHLIDNADDIRQEDALIKKISKDTHVILLSSSVIYTSSESAYKQRKLFFESIYKQHFQKLTILRLFNTYGPYQQPFRMGSFVANVFYHLIHGKILKVSNPAVKRDFIFVQDVAQIIHHIITGHVYGIFDICSGQLSAVEGIILKIMKISGRSIHFSISNEVTAEGPMGNTDLLNFISPTSLDMGLKATYSFYKNQFGTGENISR